MQIYLRLKETERCWIIKTYFSDLQFENQTMKLAVNGMTVCIPSWYHCLYHPPWLLLPLFSLSQYFILAVVFVTRFVVALVVEWYFQNIHLYLRATANLIIGGKEMAWLTHNVTLRNIVWARCTVNTAARVKPMSYRPVTQCKYLCEMLYPVVQEEVTSGCIVAVNHASPPLSNPTPSFLLVSKIVT